MTIAEHPPSVTSHMTSRADQRLTQIDEAIAAESAKITEAESVLAENEQNRAEVIALHTRQETQRATLQAALSRAQLLHSLAIGSESEDEKSQELISAQNALALCEESISHNYAVSQQFNADYEGANRQLQFDLARAGAEVEQLRAERQELLRIRQESHEKHGQETRAALLAEIEALREKEQRCERMLARAREARIAKQASIAQRLAAWPELALETETRHGHHEVSISTDMLEQWYALALEMEANAGALCYDDILPVLMRFMTIREVPLDPIRAYGKRTAFSHLPWDRKPGPINQFCTYMQSLESIKQQWHEHDVKQAIARNMTRAAQQTPL